MRLLVPRRGRRRSLGGLALLAALAGCGGGHAPKPAPAPTPDPGLAIGITEENPAFLSGSKDPQFERWHRALAQMRPTYYRFLVDWAKNVDAQGNFDPVHPQGGCLRTVPPCAGWFGIRAQLEAIAAAQKAAPGRFRVLAVVYDTPAVLARPPSGCETGDAEPRSRPPRDLRAYQDLLRHVLAEAKRAGVAIERWAPWNEPNHAYFISPQRSRCSPDAPSVSVTRYVELARAAQQVVGADKVVPAELAGVSRVTAYSTGEPEFIRALPRDLVCGAPVFTQHDYDGGPDPLPLLKRELDRLHCARPPKIWITETGGRQDRYTPAEVCRMDARNLRRWAGDPRVTAAFHYTLRQDDVYPTGLVTTDLTRAFPSLKLWQAWGSGVGLRQEPQCQ